MLFFDGLHLQMMSWGFACIVKHVILEVGVEEPLPIYDFLTIDPE